MANIESVRLPDGSEFDIVDAITPRTTASQPNLLFNPWFTVNQRGSASYTFASGTYMVDRWKTGSNQPLATLTVSDSGITINHGGSSGRAWFQQNLETATLPLIVGKTLTFSIMLSDGNIYSASATVPALTSSSVAIIDEKVAGHITLDVEVSQTFVKALVGIDEGYSFSIRAVKLEIGSTSTLHLDTAPDYTTEITKCRRYYKRITAEQNNAYFMTGYIYADSATGGQASMMLAEPMRALPTVGFGGTIKASIGGSSATVSNVSLNGRTLDTLGLSFTLSTALTQSAPCSLFFTTQGGYVELDSEL